MMMTHSYYGDANIHASSPPPGTIYRHHPRAMPASSAYYSRPAPYTYYDHPHQFHHDANVDYGSSQVIHTAIHEPESTPPSEQARRRIAVACTRCRRRKIKCSGDRGDGSPCSACRATGADVGSCNFIRVGSATIHIPGAEITPVASNVSEPTLPLAHSTMESTSGSAYGTMTYPSHPRPSLPTLQTRSSFPGDLQSQYESSPIDAYSHVSASTPRQGSVASTFSDASFRYSQAPAALSAPVSMSYLESIPTYSFGSVQASAIPPMHQHSFRHPSVTYDSHCGFNMAPLHSSLPPQTVQERRLPAPYSGPYQQNPAPTAEMTRPLGSYTDPRVHITGIHSRNAMPWSLDSDAFRFRSASTASMIPSTSMPISVAQSTTAAPDPILGYQFGLSGAVTECSSPETSPTSGPAQSDSFGSTSSSSIASMLPPPNVTFSVSGKVLPPMITSDRPSSSRSTGQHNPSLYSFSTESSDRHSLSNDYGNAQDPDSNNSLTRTVSSPTAIMHPQPQHPSAANSIDTLHRQSSHDQHQQRAYTAQRMSLSNINANY